MALHQRLSLAEVSADKPIVARQQCLPRVEQAQLQLLPHQLLLLRGQAAGPPACRPAADEPDPGTRRVRPGRVRTSVPTTGSRPKDAADRAAAARPTPATGGLGSDTSGQLSAPAASWSSLNAMPVISTVGAPFRRSTSRARRALSGRTRALSIRERRASAVCSAASAVPTLPLIASSWPASVTRRSTSTSTASSRPRDRSAYSCSSDSRWPCSSARRDSSNAARSRAERASASARVCRCQLTRASRLFEIGQATRRLLAQRGEVIVRVERGHQRSQREYAESQPYCRASVATRRPELTARCRAAERYRSARERAYRPGAERCSSRQRPKRCDRQTVWIAAMSHASCAPRSAERCSDSSRATMASSSDGVNTTCL